MPIETESLVLEKILDIAKSSGASSTEVIHSSYTSNPISFENNKLKTIETNETSGISIRLIKNKKIGFASTTDLEATKELVENAIIASEFGPDAEFNFSSGRDLPQQVSAQNSHNSNLENLIERGAYVIETLKKFHPDLLISGGFDHAYGETKYLNSNGASGNKVKSFFISNFYAQLTRPDDFLGIYEGDFSFEDFPSEKTIENKILKKLNHSIKTSSISTKVYPVIFTPQAVLSIFVHILSVILSGKAIQQGISPLINKLGQEVFDKKISFIEDPTIGINKASFDDEGIKTNKKEFIKDGVIKSFYFDLNTSSKMPSRDTPWCVSTGNGFKPGLNSVPIPMLTTTLIPSGIHSYEDSIKNIKEGILVDQLLGAGQSNTLAGEFSVGIELGFKIENGKLTNRVKNCMIAGNIFNVLKNVVEISKEQEWVHGASLLPYIMVENMTVAGK